MARDVDVTIVASKDASGNIDFHMEQRNQYTELLVFNKTKDNMSKSDHYLINFTLDDQSGEGLKFNQTNTIYISKGSDKHVPKCPMNGSVGGPNEFSVVGTPTNTKLTVKNDDMNECFYKFVLNFEDSSGKRHVFDPIFGNQNGGFSFMSSSLTTTGVLAGAGTALAISLISASATAAPLLMNIVIGAGVGIVAALLVMGLGRGLK